MYFFVLQFWLNIFLGVGLLNHMIILFLSFWGTSILFFTAATPAYIPTNIVVGFPLLQAFLVPPMAKTPPAMQETWVWCLGWKDHLEEGVTTHSGILAWRIPWTEEPGGLHTVPEVQKESGMAEWLSLSIFSTSSPAFVICRLFNDGHSDWCEVLLVKHVDFHTITSLFSFSQLLIKSY